MKIKFKHEDIIKKIEEIASNIHPQPGDIFLCVLGGAFMFYSELVSRLKEEIIVDFIKVQSYDGVASSTINMMLPMKNNPLYKNVWIVEDIVDSGKTIKFIEEHLTQYGVSSIKIVTLLDKPSARLYDTKVDYSCFTVEKDEFIVGFGLDYKEKFRNYQNIYVMEPKDVN